MTLKEKLELWTKITGINPEDKQTAYTIYMDGRMSNYDIKCMNDKIMKSLKEDETGIFTEAYLAIYFEKYLKDRKLSLYDLISDKTSETLLADVKMLNDALTDRKDHLIVEQAKKAMAFYGLSCDLDVGEIIEIRMSAIKCMKYNRLKLIQLAEGSVGEEFKFDRNIYTYRNMDALALSAARGTLSGVSLAFIRDMEEETASFFGFIIKNGENLWFLSDMPSYVHPLQKGMLRCPGRTMSERIESNFFPYDSAANIDISDLWDRGRYGRGSAKGTDLIEDEVCRVKISDIGKITPYEAFWTIIMVSLIKEKFYDAPVLPALPISYTKSMIISPLIEQSETALIVQDKLKSVHIEPVSIDDTKDIKFGRNHDTDTDLEDISYLIDRYKDQVNTEELNIIKDTKSAELEHKYEERNFWGVTQRGLKALDLSEPKTEEELVYQQKWMARYNYATAIKSLMVKDYEENGKKIREQIGGMIKNRLEDICIMHLKRELVESTVKRQYSFGTYKDTASDDEYVPFSWQEEFNKWYSASHSGANYEFISDKRYPSKADIRCALTGDKAGVIITIIPHTLRSLTTMLGVSKEELPVQLQHWDPQDKYYGNNILDNIDPLLTECSDIFNENMRFDTVIALSKKEYLRLCEKAGITPVKFWLSEKPVCFSPWQDNKEVCKGANKSRYNSKTWKHEYSLCEKCRKCKWFQAGNDVVDTV